MSHSIGKIKFPELFIGFVAPVGADLSTCLLAFRRFFSAQGYDVVEIKVTDAFPWFSGYVGPDQPLKRKPLVDRYKSYIAYGNQLREKFDDDVLAAYAVNRIVSRRTKVRGRSEYSKTVYLLHQFKRPEEIELLRSVYGELFFQVSIYSRRGARVSFLADKFAKSMNIGNVFQYRAEAEQLCQQDENEVDARHGQRVGKIFHDADLIISLDVREPSPEKQVDRFCNLTFSDNSLSPTKMEFGLYLAHAAALRTLDLSRQVGAALFNESCDVISVGCNEVPRANGGAYWCDTEFDDREFKRGVDSNDLRKREILAEIVDAVDPKSSVDEWLQNQKIKDSQFMDALEYGRIVHAEMSAISDAARLGRLPIKVHCM